MSPDFEQLNSEESVEQSPQENPEAEATKEAEDIMEEIKAKAKENTAERDIAAEQEELNLINQELIKLLEDNQDFENKINETEKEEPENKEKIKKLIHTQAVNYFTIKRLSEVKKNKLEEQSPDEPDTLSKNQRLHTKLNGEYNE